MKRTICCLLSGRGSSQKAREETWRMSEPSWGDAQSPARAFPGEPSPDPRGRTGAQGPQLEEDGRRRGGELGEPKLSILPHSRSRSQPGLQCALAAALPGCPGLPGDLQATACLCHFFILDTAAPAPCSAGLCAAAALHPALGEAPSSSGEASHPFPPPEQSLNDKSLRGL